MKGLVKVKLSAMASLHSSLYKEVTLLYDSKLYDCVVRLQNWDAIPCNSFNNPNVCRTVSISRIGTTTELWKSLRELGVKDGDEICWGFF